MSTATAAEMPAIVSASEEQRYAELQLIALDHARCGETEPLVAMVKALSKDVVTTVVEATPASIEFIDGGHDIRVSTKTLKLVVTKHMDHDVTCGNKQWFQPLSTVEHAQMGATDENMFDGPSLGTRWSDPNKRSAFFGTFAY